MGPQGSGKSTLAQLIVAGAAGRAVHLLWEDAVGVSNAEIRKQHADKAFVCVEAMRRQCRHYDLLPGDAVMVVAAEPVDATAGQQEARHAA